MKKTADKILDNDYERMIPELHTQTLMYAEHMTRYYAATDIVKNKTVLDIASGSGYGTKMLAKHARKVYGVDVNEAAVKYSKKHFSGDNIEYLVGDGESIPLKDSSVDVVITLETIEHIQDYKKFIDEIERVLRPDGLLIVSTPNDLEFAEGNHFHLHEFEYKELVDLLKSHFEYIKPYFQATWKYVAIESEDKFNKSSTFNISTINLAPKEREKYLYFYILCSKRDIKENIVPVAALGEHYSDRAQATEKSERAETERILVARCKQADKEIKQLQQDVQLQQNETIQIKKEFNTIVNSRAYRYACKARELKAKILG